MSTALLSRLLPVYDETPAVTTMANQAGWRPGTFGDAMPEVRAIVAHVTEGWPSRDKAGEFVRWFTTPGIQRYGFGPQFLVTGDGTVFRLIDLPLATLHTTFVNTWALGVETGRLARKYFSVSPAHKHPWIRLSTDAPDDIPGANVYVNGINGEVVVAWWITSAYSGPGRLPTADPQMLITEAQYRGWARLSRYLAAEFKIPRNFPLLPYERRPDNLGKDAADQSAAQRFRKIVFADAGFEMLVRSFAPLGITSTDFEPFHLATLQTAYAAAVQTPPGDKEHNLAWRALFDQFRGFHGHGFAGAVNKDDHADCPGDLFDWHRLACEVWDWWWHPFDFNSAGTLTLVPIRPYRQARRDTPLVEYYFEEPESRYAGRRTTGFPAAPRTPDTFRLEPGSPVYASANGRLIAARLSDHGNDPSLAFVLIRHEIYHRVNDALAQIAPSLGMMPFEAEAIDYAHEPSYVYTLVMHLGRMAGINFDQVSDGNPDWLNRVLIRLKECELGVKFYDEGRGSSIDAALWNSPPPGQGLQRPTILEGWRFDRDHGLRRFVDELRAGRMALGPHFSDGYATPIEVHLGDFLGTAGVLSRSDAETVHGIRVEAFSTDPLSMVDFMPLVSQGWPVPEPETPLPLAVHYRSEWSIEPPPVLARLLASMGIDSTLIHWWPDVSAHLLSDMLLPAAAKLPINGFVWHYRLHDFMRWLNRITWRSEWLKYNVTVSGVRMAPPDAPRPRRL